MDQVRASGRPANNAQLLYGSFIGSLLYGEYRTGQDMYSAPNTIILNATQCYMILYDTI
jgi:hypothetical protein